MLRTYLATNGKETSREMKKGDILEGRVIRTDFPNKGIVEVQTEDDSIYVTVKNALPGQTVKCLINKKKHGHAEGRLLEVKEPAIVEEESACPHYGACGGCLYQKKRAPPSQNSPGYQRQREADTAC